MHGCLWLCTRPLTRGLMGCCICCMECLLSAQCLLAESGGETVRSGRRQRLPGKRGTAAINQYAPTGKRGYHDVLSKLSQVINTTSGQEVELGLWFDNTPRTGTYFIARSLRLPQKAGRCTGEVESGDPSRPERFESLLTRPDPICPVMFQTPPDPTPLDPWVGP